MAGYICVTLENGHCFDINPQGLIIDQAPYIANGWVGCQVENSRQGTRLQIMAKNGVRWHSTQMIVHVQPLIHPLERQKK